MDLIIDNFAGGGGASTGIEAALGRPVDVAINHDPEAIAMHRANHPLTRHLCESVFAVDPHQIARGRRVGFGWFSPDCTFHSKARGGKPFRDRDTARRRRGLAGIIPRWLTATGMDVFGLENVEEFADWGPLLEDGRICPKRRGMLFRRWHSQIENIVSRQTGRHYRIDMREMPAHHFGAPTTRKRLFILGRADGREIVFPAASHGHWIGAKPFRTAAECIDWSIPCPSIFERSRPLAEATLRRIARGVMRYVVNSPAPFIVGIDNQSNGARDAWAGSDPLRTITTENRFALVAPAIANTRNGERVGQAPRVRSIEDPLPTVTAQGSQGALVAAFLAKHYGGVVGHDMQRPIGAVTTVDHHSLVTSHLLHLRRNCDGWALDEPLRTVSAQGNHFGEVRAFLVAYYGNDKDGQKLGEPLRTVTTKDRLGLVTVHGEPYQIVDIGMRMLTPRELFRAQSFPDSYIIDHGIDESGARMPMTKTAQVRMCGNSVCPAVAEAIVRANVVEQAEQVAA